MQTWQMKCRQLVANVQAHDFERRLKMRRDGIAREMGLPEGYDTGTYPMPNVSVRFSGLRGVVLGGLMAAIGAGGALGLASLLGAFEKPAKPAVETPSFRYRIRFGYKDGKPFRELLDESGKVVKESE